MAIIEIEDIFFSYRDGTEALRGLSLYIEKGEKVALLGPNGAGKSTFLLHLNGINLPQRGRVLVLGREIDKKSEKWVRSKVGLVFQDPDDQVFSPTVWEDVAFGPRNMGLDRQEIEDRVNNSLEAVGMSGYGSRAPYHLSYGQKKRVAIAGVLAMQPEIIVLDEPMAFLDPRGKDTLQDILNWMHDRGQTIIIATHDVDFTVEWADRVVILKDGKTLAQGGRGILRNQALVEEAQLRLPLVSRIFLKSPGATDGPLPQTVAEAAGIINGLLESRGAGTDEKEREAGMDRKNAPGSERAIWLEPEHLHYHPGVVQVRALWGRMMQREDISDIKGWYGYAVSPEGKVLEADIADSAGNYKKLAFIAGEEGLYELMLENEAVLDGGVRHVQRARLPLPVGHDVRGGLKNIGEEGLDIFCEEFKEYGLGQSIAIRVLYNGRPLPGAGLKATYHFYEGDGWPWEGVSGADGRTTFTFFEKGHWLFSCTYVGTDTGQESEHDNTVFTSTFVIPGVR